MERGKQSFNIKLTRRISSIIKPWSWNAGRQNLICSHCHYIAMLELSKGTRKGLLIITYRYELEAELGKLPLLK